MKTPPFGSLRLDIRDSKSHRRGRLFDSEYSTGCAARPVRFFLLAGFLLLLTASAGRVLGQPTITNQPRTQAVPPGANVTFSVGASGPGPLVYQWQRNPGTGFSDLADCTNAVLALSNAQPWDAVDYRVVVTDLTGARTSAVAHLYVMSPGFLTGRVVVDDFDDNKLTRWTLLSGGALTETNQRLTVSGHWPGVISYDPPETVASALLQRNWSIADGTTVEWRTDLVGMSEHATAALLEVVHAGADGLYVMFKGRDFIKVNKYFVNRGPAHFLHENVSIRLTNVVLALSLTRVSPDLILTARVLDRANPGVVLYERSVVDTPDVDPSLTEAEQEAASNMHLKAVSDLRGPPWFSEGYMLLDVWQYNFDGLQPAAQVTFDNVEVWTYRVPAVHYVDPNSPGPAPPYATWPTAATNIQAAVDAAVPGDEIVVTNGIYATGGRAVGTNLLVNRVAVDKPLTLRSVNGPEFTVIQGYQVPGSTNGDGAIRCVYLADGASLSGFTLTNGATLSRTTGTGWEPDHSGGGLWCESTNATVSNCVLAGNAAHNSGGGAFGGTLHDCLLAGNSVDTNGGGGASGGTLYNCTLTDNVANQGGGAADSTLNHCTLTRNSVGWAGAGAKDSTLANCMLSSNSAGYRGGGADNCTLNNCILVGNSAREYGGGVNLCTLNSCTLTGNSVTGNSGGLGFAGGANGGTLNNCILYFNTAPTDGNYRNGTVFFCPPVMNYCSTTPLPTDGVGNITNAPLFVDYAGGDLRLQSNSPCINAGNNAYVTSPTDLDGDPRIVRGTVDLGAYEHQGPGSTVSYAWLQQYGLPTDGSADAMDADADGHNTWQEWKARTDPSNPLSALRLLSVSSDGIHVNVTWESVAGVNYTLERSTNVVGPPPIFMPLATGVPGQSGLTTFTDTNAARITPLFYRVGVAN